MLGAVSKAVSREMTGVTTCFASSYPPALSSAHVGTSSVSGEER